MMEKVACVFMFFEGTKEVKEKNTNNGVLTVIDTSWSYAMCRFSHSEW